MNFSSQSQCTINLENMKKAQGMKVIDDNLIFFDNWSELEDASYVTWISFYGPKCEAEKNKYSVKVISSKDQRLGKRKFLFEATAFCVPCDITFNQMKREWDCIVLSKTV